MNKNYYKILGVSQDATQEEIKKAYFAKAKMYHPDVCKDKDAEEKFKAISTAYETLKNDQSRQEYNEALRTNSFNSSSSSSSSNQETDFNSLHTIFSAINKPDDYFVDFINQKFKSEQEVGGAYSYFWLSFWSGGKGTVEMLKHKNASQIFKAFCGNKFIAEMKKSLVKSIDNNPEQQNLFNHMKKSLEKLYNDIPEEKINSQASYNLMIRVIHEDNVFDDPNSMYYFLLLKNEVVHLLEKFERIFDGNADIRARTHYSSNARAKRGGGIFSSIFTTVAIIIVIRWIFFR